MTAAQAVRFGSLALGWGESIAVGREMMIDIFIITATDFSIDFSPFPDNITHQPVGGL
jgi:hypothetical protein